MDLIAIQQLLGHWQIGTTMRYVTPSSTFIEDAYRPRCRRTWPNSKEAIEMEVTWRLRMAAAQREVWTGAALRRLLAERAGVDFSPASVSALLTGQPRQLKLSTLAALCTALECGPADLIEVDTTPVVPVARPAGPSGRSPQRARDERCPHCEGLRRMRGRTPLQRLHPV